MSGRFSLKRRFFPMKEQDFTDAVKRTIALMEEKFGVKMKYELNCYAGIKTTTSFYDPDHSAYLAEENEKHCLASKTTLENMPWKQSKYVECKIIPVDEDSLRCCYCWISAKGLTSKVIPFLMASNGENGEAKVAEIEAALTSNTPFAIGDGFEKNTNLNGSVSMSFGLNHGVMVSTKNGPKKII